MSTTTPMSELPHRQRSTSRTRRNPPSRPTTPLRPPSRTSLRASTTTPQGSQFQHSSTNAGPLPLETLEPAFAELSDSMADLEANMMHLQLLHESVARFNENFAAFLYGLNMSAFCVDFPEAPGVENLRRAKESGMLAAGGAGTGQMDMGREGGNVNVESGLGGGTGRDVDATFLTTDTSFVENPPASIKKPSKYASLPASSIAPPRTGGAPRGGSTRGRGIPARGTRGGSTRGSGIGRGIPGRGVARGVR